MSQSAPTSDPLPDEAVTQDSPPAGGSRFSFLLAQGLVIVVSVLFALAVDRVVMGWDERNLERTYLEGLLEDFGNIEAQMQSAMSAAAKRDTSTVIVLAVMRGNPPTDLSGLDLARALELSGWVLDPQFSRDTWDDMVGTGRVGALRNVKLRRDIALMYRQVDQLHLFAREWTQLTREYGAVVRTILEPELRVAIGSEFIYDDSIPSVLAPDAARLARTIATNPDLAPAIGDVLLINNVSARLYAQLSEQARSIAELIRTELGGSS
jgi:hypothetical protein